MTKRHVRESKERDTSANEARTDQRLSAIAPHVEHPMLPMSNLLPMPSTLPTSQSPSRRIRSLRALMTRENVRLMLAASGVDKMRIILDLANGERDSKVLDIGDTEKNNGCVIIIILDDNPENVGAAFHDIQV